MSPYEIPQVQIRPLDLTEGCAIFDGTLLMYSDTTLRPRSREAYALATPRLGGKSVQHS